MSFGYVAAATVGSALIGYVASENATSAASDAAAASNATQRQAAQLQYDLGKETLEFNKKYYEETIKPAADFDLQSRREMMPTIKRALFDQEEFSRQQRQDYLDNWRPLEQRVREDALGYDSDANVNRRMGIAAANVNQQFSNAAGQRNRAMSVYGVSPNSNAFFRTNANLFNQEALAAAGAQTSAAFDTMDRGIALRAGAANFGRNMPNTSATFGQLGNQTAGTANATTAGGVGVANAAGSFMNQGIGLAGSLNASGAGIDNNIFKNNLAMADIQSRGVGQLFQGIGQGVGMWGRAGGFGTGAGSASNFAYGDVSHAAAVGLGTMPAMADGGHVGDAVDASGLVHGPGGPRDDLVPVHLSKNEFVLNEGAVRHFGLDKLNKMNAIGLENQARRGLLRSA